MHPQQGMKIGLALVGGALMPRSHRGSRRA
jgi:hypothetical protein